MKNSPLPPELERPPGGGDGDVNSGSASARESGQDSTDARLRELLRRTQALAAQLKGLNEAAIAITKAGSLDAVLREITERARTLIPSHQAVTSMSIDQNFAQAINAVSLSDKYARYRTYSTPSDGSGIYAEVCRTNQPMRMTQEELEAHPLFRDFGAHKADHPPMRGWLAAPLVGEGGRNIGLVELSDKVSGEFTEDDLAVLVQLAQMASSAIESARIGEASRKREQRLQAALLAWDLGTYLCEPSSGTIDLDDGVRRLFGFASGEGGTLDEYTARIHPNDRRLWTITLERCIRDVTDFELEYRIIRPDGEVRWVLDRAKLSGAGVDVHMAGACVDITFRKNAEEERELLLAEAGLKRVEAEEANRVKDEFLATISHEIRTPLTAILGWAQMLKKFDLADPKVRKGVDVIERNAWAQTRLVEDILDVSRIITGKLRIEARPVSLRAAVEGALETVRSGAEAKGIAVDVQIDPAVGPLLGDQDRLQQVIWNLLSNAVKFTPRGGQIAVSVRGADGQVEIAVSDTGKGIPTDFLPFVFDRFSQAEGGTSRTQAGLGLGLAIVRHLVELHGGTVHAASEGDERGATFIVRLPVRTSVPAQEGDEATPASSEKAPPMSAAPDALSGVRVLVVDDETDARELIRLMLERTGATTHGAASAEEAFAALSSFHPNVLVSDIGMPGEDGYSLITRIRLLGSEDPRGEIPAVALSAYARVDDHKKALLAGFDAHVAKPVSQPELIATVKRLARAPTP
jgi:signal transduction histidine kinase/ActR/RegA family two-component response regulator